MSKLIAIWGSPSSGKTTFATKLALCIYESYRSTVLELLCRNETPALPVLFPKRKADELFSVGVPLSKTDITQNDVIESIVTVKEKQNFGFLGFKDGENKYTYPKYDDEKAKAFLSVLKSLADYVIVDCDSELTGLSAAAVKTADMVIRLAAPDLKSISFFASQLPLYGDSSFKTDQHIIGITVTENGMYLPIEETKTHYKDVSFVLPYCREVKAQMLNGELTQTVSDKKYKDMIKKITEKVV
jgi:CO dehydrogenase nickel-insertion accessory protein CooC1